MLIYMFMQQLRRTIERLRIRIRTRRRWQRTLSENFGCQGTLYSCLSSCSHLEERLLSKGAPEGYPHLEHEGHHRNDETEKSYANPVPREVQIAGRGFLHLSSMPDTQSLVVISSDYLRCAPMMQSSYIRRGRREGFFYLEDDDG